MNRRKRKKPSSSMPKFTLNSEQLLIMMKQKWSLVVEHWNSLPNFHRKALTVLAPLMVVLLLWPVSESIEDPAASVTSTERRGVELNTRGLSEQRIQVANENDDPPSANSWREYEVKGGDTLSNVFRANKLPMSDLYALAAVEGVGKPLSNIKKGQLLRYKLNKSGELDILQLEKEDSSVMFLRLSDGSFGRSR